MEGFDDYLQVKTKEATATGQFPFDPGAVKLSAEDETATDENCKGNAKDGTFIFQGQCSGTFISPDLNDPDAGKMFKESKMCGHFPYNPGTCDAKVEDYFQGVLKKSYKL